MGVCVEGATTGRQRQVRYVMIVGGDAHQVFTLAMLLQRFEYHVCTARSMAEAFETIGVAAPALVITALDLPGGAGLDLLQEIRTRQATKELPVIAMTGDRDPETAARCVRSGFAACLTTPVAAEELYRAVQFALEPTPRSNIRVQARLPVSVNGELLDCGGECATVLSEHGMYIRTLKPSPVNSQLAVTVALGGGEIEIDAVVLYSHRFGEGPFGQPGMGMRFLRINAEDQDRIRAFIQEEVTRGIEGGGAGR